MAHVEIEGDRLVVVIRGLAKLWSLRSRFVIPLAHVQGATIDGGIVRDRKGVRAPGTYIPRIITAGTFHQDGERVFWDVRRGDRAVVIQLRDEKYARLVVEVDDPRDTVALVERALAARA